ncbi:MAG: NADH:ubiquinone reductase (Na(+)-transporting) subunit C [Saprospiraceae bacterium]|nr:MAG: NADH:ubiquinone reductase (Na(+)-transporting) subunit C [Saprospiraceae bacterium]
MYSNKYITIYTLVMTLIVSIVLAIVVTGLAPIHSANEAVFKKKEIFSAIQDQIGSDLTKMSNKEILELFDQRIEQVVLDANGKPVEGIKAEDIDLAKEEKKPESERHYPLFIYKGDKGNIYIVSVRGMGLWDKIWGTIAFEDDLNTVAGASFGHVGETPGLGAEIKDNPTFRKQFEGKTIFKDGQYVSVGVIKGGAKDKEHEVDAISGATLTSRGVSEMMQRGLKPYLPYFEELKKQGGN